MFGYLTACSDIITPEQLQRYRGCYCGLCRSLKARHGISATLTLNYDMTFLVLFLSSLYEPVEYTEKKVCLLHCGKGKLSTGSSITDYAADMNVALAYFSCLDDWNDEKKLLAYSEAAILKKAYERISGQYPRQVKAIREGIERLSVIEKSGLPRPDEAAECFGGIMAEIFTPFEDNWAPHLRSFGDALGRFIYIMDASVDLERDCRRNNYNPFSDLSGNKDNGNRFREILKMLMGNVVASFNYFPIINDVGLMNNILCAGIWGRFNNKYCNKEGSDEQGSV